MSSHEALSAKVLTSLEHYVSQVRRGLEECIRHDLGKDVVRGDASYDKDGYLPRRMPHDGITS